MTNDPVCGMEIEQKDAKRKGLSSSFEGQMYYFCSLECRESFDENPEQYVGSLPERQRQELLDDDQYSAE